LACGGSAQEAEDGVLDVVRVVYLEELANRAEEFLMTVF
jgi:hypothetical protein